MYKAKDLQMVAREGEDSDCIVAIKKIKLGSRQETRDGINRTALRLVQKFELSSQLTLFCSKTGKSNCCRSYTTRT